MGNKYSNPYRDESIASAISGLGGAIFGHPEAMNAALDRSLRQQQLSQTQDNWQADYDHKQRAFGLQQSEDTRQAERHNLDKQNLQLEIDAARAEAFANQDKLSAHAELLEIFKNANNYQIINGKPTLDPKFTPLIQSLYFRINPESSLNQDHLGVFGADPVQGTLKTAPNGQLYTVSPDVNNPVAVPVTVQAPGAQDASGGHFVSNPNYGNPPSQEDALPVTPVTGDPVDPTEQIDFTTPNPSVADVIAPATVPQNAPGQPLYVDMTGASPDPLWGTPRQRATSAETAQKLAMSGQGFVNDLNSMINNPDLLEGSRIGVGIPGLDQVIMGASEYLNTDKMTDVRAIESIRILDWLESSQKLKGAITERETSMLRASQPPPNASAESKKTWLQNLMWYTLRETLWNDALAQSAQKGEPPPNGVEFSLDYETKFPRPKKVKKGELRQTSTPTGNQTQPTQAGGPSEKDLQFMTPEERALFGK